MKLELKHLAPYLPYGLKCYWGEAKRKTDISNPVQSYLFLLKQKSEHRYKIRTKTLSTLFAL